ncbi:nucleotide exchange factor GrpE [Dactylosporangium sp. AC04546]|uniref:nucleotide exchange factor GrpE n=1 Tax=Dactylosporangium sp. AC04546 TaxID=2862460 RepID=UPI001EDFC6BD|nr:nucleotide exchange factor GrpE [Dactylosporangium sp. AC04546]WVK87011.1 nucleotide exchange factor GrpE [Dactylosporangium sp. AC04546]
MPAPADRGATADSAALTQLLNICIDQADRLRDQNEVLWRQFNSRLALVDVEVIMADGEPFNSDRHDATGREATTDASRHMTVATTELVGYRRNGRYLRRPKVVVYRADLDQAGTAG